MEKRLNRKTKIFYGVAGIGDAATYACIGTFALFFFTTVAGINPAVGGAIVAIGAVWDVVSGSIAGYISDRTHSRYGKRKPFVMVAAFPIAVFCSLIFTVFDVPQMVRNIYYIVMFITFWTAYSFFFVPYTAWGAELTDNYEERTELRGIVYVFYSVGAAFGTVLPPLIVDFIVQWGAGTETGWLSVGIFVGVISGAAIFFSGWFVNDNTGTLPDIEEEASSSGGLHAMKEIITNYAQVLKFKPARYIIIASMMYLIGNSIYSADRMYFYTFNMGLSAKMISLIALFQQVISLLLVPALTGAGKLLDKRTILIGGLGIAAAALIVFGFIGISNAPMLFVFSFFYGIASICYWQLIPSMLYDVCDADRLDSGLNRTGIIVSFQGLTESVSEAIGFQALGLLLNFTGFKSTLAMQNQATLTCMHWAFTFLPAAFMIFTMLAIMKYPLTREKHAEIMKKLNE